MADPPPFPFSDLHFNGALTSLVPEVGVGNDFWPFDVDDVSEASVDKGLQLMGIKRLKQAPSNYLFLWARYLCDRLLKRFLFFSLGS